jgi:hypothetical protein
MVPSKHGEVDELTKDLHWDIPRYYTHYARIKLLKAKATDNKQTRELLLDKALEDLDRGLYKKYTVCTLFILAHLIT